jgi:hypothetical protein
MTTAVGIGSGATFWLDECVGHVLTQLSEIISVSCPNLADRRCRGDPHGQRLVS